MVADALEVLGDHQQVDGLGAVVGVLADQADQLVLHHVEQIVDDVIHLHHLSRQLQIPVHIGVQTAADHADCGLGHLGQVLQLLQIRRVGQIDHQTGDVRRLIADALHVGDHLQRRGDLPQIPRHGLLLQKQLQAQALDLLFLLIHLVIRGDGGVCSLHVLADQRLGGTSDGLLDQRSHFQQFPVEQTQLLVKSNAHQPNLPVM